MCNLSHILERDISRKQTLKDLAKAIALIVFIHRLINTPEGQKHSEKIHTETREQITFF